MSRVRNLAQTIMENPKYLSVDKQRVREVADLLKDVPLSIPDWRMNFRKENPAVNVEDFEEVCKFFLIFNSINYCYFDEDGNKFEDNGVSGSTLAFKRIEEHWAVLQDPAFLANVDENYLLGVLFKAQSPISMVRERVQCLREVGKFLLAATDFTFDKFFRRYRQDAYFASQVLPVLLPCWRDPFYKRSQLFVGMVYGAFQAKEDLPINKESLPNLTVFADYRVPQALLNLDIIKPSATLMKDVLEGRFIPTGSQKELMLRAATVVGGDLLTEAFKEVKGDPTINALHTDFMLWSAGRVKVDKDKELYTNLYPRKWQPDGSMICFNTYGNHHRTMTTDY